MIGCVSKSLGYASSMIRTRPRLQLIAFESFAKPTRPHDTFKSIDECFAAVMDVHIRGERVFPMCELLDAKGVPFVLTSGYADWQIPDKWADRPRLTKPYTLADVERALENLLAG